MSGEVYAVLDDREVSAMLTRLQRKMSNMKPVLTRIGALYEARVLENFRNESAPDGTPWKPLAQDTMLIGLKRRKGFRPVRGGLSAKGKRYITGKRILRDSGDLEGSIHFQATTDSVTIGSSGSIPYAAIHQLSGKAGRGHKVSIPAREYLGMNSGGDVELAEVDRRWIMDLVSEELATV